MFLFSLFFCLIDLSWTSTQAFLIIVARAHVLSLKILVTRMSKYSKRSNNFQHNTYAKNRELCHASLPIILFVLKLHLENMFCFISKGIHIENYKSTTQILQCMGPKMEDKDIIKYAFLPNTMALGGAKERKDIVMER